MASVRSRLRGRVQRGETIVAPGAYDPLSARVVQALGFSTVYTGGYMTGAHTSITEPLLTLTEQVEVAQKVARAVDLPVLADAGAGYGDPLHVMRCVREFEAAGIAGIHIEDQVYPKRASYHKGLEHIVPLEEFVERMTYALQARRDPDFLIIGRTDAFSAVEGSRDELVRRGLALKDLGVDAVMPRGVRAREDLTFFRKEVPGVPLLVIAGGIKSSSTPPHRRSWLRMPCWKPTSTSKTRGCSTSMRGVSLNCGGASRSSSVCRSITKWKQPRPRKGARLRRSITDDESVVVPCMVIFAVGTRARARSLCAADKSIAVLPGQPCHRAGGGRPVRPGGALFQAPAPAASLPRGRGWSAERDAHAWRVTAI
jgi:2-methylisocitrate lyase-like PEP mutase family enzyme